MWRDLLINNPHLLWSASEVLAQKHLFYAAKMASEIGNQS